LEGILKFYPAFPFQLRAIPKFLMKQTSWQLTPMSTTKQRLCWSSFKRLVRPLHLPLVPHQLNVTKEFSTEEEYDPSQYFQFKEEREWATSERTQEESDEVSGVKIFNRANLFAIVKVIEIFAITSCTAISSK
jgi:hypothetical protein